VQYNITQEINSELTGSENLLWSGQPRKGILFRSSDIFLIPFSLLWCGFAFFWEYNVVTGGAPFFFMLWGVPFVVVGLYIVFGRFFVEAKQREKTVYGLTSERIIIVSGLLSRKVKSLSIKNLSESSLSEKHDHSGTINFGSVNPLHSMFGGMSWPGMGQNISPSFDMIENAKSVHEMILRVQKDA
jgi:hypothetical protein